MSDSAAHSKSSLPSGAWLAVALLWLVALLNYLDRLMITTIRDPLKLEITMTDAQFGLLTSMFLWIYGALSPLGGYLADRFGRRTVIIASLAVWSAVTWLTGHVRSFEELLLARSLMGISEACYIPAALALITDYHRGPTRSLATGIHMSGVYAGAALGGIGGYIAEHFGWRSSFTWFGAFGVAYSVVLFLLLRDAQPLAVTSSSPDKATADEIRIPQALRSLLQQPAFWILFAVNALVGVANWGANGWLPTYLKEHFMLGLGEAGLSATGYIQVASFAGVLTGGIWADRWAKRQPNARSLVPAIGYCVVGPCLFISASTGALPLAVAGLIVFGLGRGFFDANHMPIVRGIVNERYGATGFGLLNFVSCAAGGVMVYVGGMLRDAKVDLSKIFQFSAASMFVAGLLLFAIRTKTPSLNTTSP